VVCGRKFRGTEEAGNGLDCPEAAPGVAPKGLQGTAKSKAVCVFLGGQGDTLASSSEFPHVCFGFMEGFRVVWERPAEALAGGVVREPMRRKRGFLTVDSGLCFPVLDADGDLRSAGGTRRFFCGICEAIPGAEGFFS
jgi:hypothetical protein